MDIKELIAADRLVIVTAADFNGKDFDGSPLSPAKEGGSVQWVIDAKPKIEARGSTDYAWFGFTGEGVDLTWAGPGDYLFNTLNKYYPVVVIPRVVMEALLAEPKVVAAKLARATREGYFLYASRTYSVTDLKVLMSLRKGAATVLELHGRLGATQNSITNSLSHLRVGKMVAESERSAFSRQITTQGEALLASNPDILPAD